MSKVVLVMDMPESCSKCGLHYKLPFETEVCCSELKAAPKEKRADFCPLRELPEKIHNDNGYDEYSDGWDTGWNACLDKILEKEDYENE